MKNFFRKLLTILAPVLGAGAVGACPLCWLGSASLLTYLGLGALIPIWRVVVFIFLGLGLAGFILDFRAHKKPWPLLLLVVGGVALYLGRYVYGGPGFAGWPIWGAGGLLIIASVVWNKQLFKSEPKAPHRKILFACTENAGRSQMAEAFFNHYAGGTGLEAESAGTIPAGKVNPMAVAVMKEKGVDISSAKPKKFDPQTVDKYEKLISFGCLVKETFPKHIQEKIEDWLIDDPTGKSIGEVRKIRDEIENEVKKLLAKLQY